MSTSETFVLESDASSSDNDESVTPTSLSSIPRKRRLKKKRNPVWLYARRPIEGVEPLRTGPAQGKRRIWYCKYERCNGYSVLSTNGAKHHMSVVHGVTIEGALPSKACNLRQQDLRQVVSQHKQQENEKKAQDAQEALQEAANPAHIHQALLRLIVHHDLPLNAIEWPELHTLVYTINYTASNCIWKSHRTVSQNIDKTFITKKIQLKNVLQQSKSLIHLTTDTWHSPNFKELQAITASFVDADGNYQKALLDLCELPQGHSGTEVAPIVLEVLEDFEITERLGYITTDNHGANDTLCRALSEALSKQLKNWQPSERRLRYIGYIINIAVQAFFFAKNKEAIEMAIQAASSLTTSIDEQLVLLSEKDENAGWINVQPLQKILIFVRIIRKSDKLYNAFKKKAGKTIRAPNDTRWNSYLTTFEDAYDLKGSYSALILEHQAQLLECELSTTEWQLVEQTITFLTPFKEATKQCEGDYVTLDRVQLHMDALIDHYQDQQHQYKANKSFTESIITSWYAFDKYYGLIDETGAYTAAILLHPNRRKSYLQSAWKKSWIEPGLDRVRKLWHRYKEELVEENTDSSNLSYVERWLQKVQAKQSKNKGAMDEFERFIIAPPDKVDIAVLDWWQQDTQQRSYPQLSRMAIDVLSAQAMSADCERVFSGTRRTIPWTRIRLEGPMIVRLECLKHWQKSGVVDEQFEGVGDDEVLI
jgi:hypothetical protein